jgi:hypothetical protein
MGSLRFYKVEQLCSVTSSFPERSIDTELAIKNSDLHTSGSQFLNGRKNAVPE